MLHVIGPIVSFMDMVISRSLLLWQVTSPSVFSQNSSTSIQLSTHMYWMTGHGILIYLLPFLKSNTLEQLVLPWKLQALMTILETHWLTSFKNLPTMLLWEPLLYGKSLAAIQQEPSSVTQTKREMWSTSNIGIKRTHRIQPKIGWIRVLLREWMVFFLPFFNSKIYMKVHLFSRAITGAQRGWISLSILMEPTCPVHSRSEQTYPPHGRSSRTLS